ncbi:MAG: hypothetical protein U9O94_01785, partial [Nanoarchaeota archaeon]|nr:hypothetical protein [Nanoarchaeota archaeon]
MALDEEYLKRLKVIFNRGYKKSKKYTAQKINLISSVKETYDRINQTLTGSDLGDSVEKVFEIILKEHWFHDYDSFRENFNPFLKHKLTNKEWEFLWILYNKDFKKFQKNLLVQLLQLLDKQHTFFVNMATFLHKLTIKLGTQPVQNRQIKQFLFFVNSIWVDILNIKGIQDKQMRALMKGDVQNLLSESSNENVINAEIGDKADKFFGIKKELQKPQNVSRRTFIQQTAAVGLAAIFFSGRKALASTDSQEQDNTYSSGSKTAAHELLEMESKQFGISKSAAVEILNSIIDEAKK